MTDQEFLDAVRALVDPARHRQILPMYEAVPWREGDLDREDLIRCFRATFPAVQIPAELAFEAIRPGGLLQ